MTTKSIRHFIRSGQAVCGVNVRPDDRERATTDEGLVECARCSRVLQAGHLARARKLGQIRKAR